jgi:cytochrome b
MCVGAVGVSRPKDKAYVWDLPIRLFHWSLVILIIAAFVTAKLGGAAMVWHGRLGLTICGLLVFRLAWGFIGSTYARFSQFLPGPAAIRHYLAGEWHQQGHNPVGALSVLVLLGFLSAMVATGLFANDDIAFEGYLYPLVSSDFSTWITGIHHLLEKLLMALVALHVGAIVFYARVKKHNLVKPMLTGWAPGKPCESAKGGGAIALLVAATFAGLAVWAASGALLPAPPPAPAGQQAPDF